MVLQSVATLFDYSSNLAKYCEIQIKQLLLAAMSTQLHSSPEKTFLCSFKSIIKYIDDQFEKYLHDESGLNRRHIVDNRVHCCFYFINPAGHGYVCTIQSNKLRLILCAWPSIRKNTQSDLNNVTCDWSRWLSWPITFLRSGSHRNTHYIPANTKHLKMLGRRCINVILIFCVCRNKCKY